MRVPAFFPQPIWSGNGLTPWTLALHSGILWWVGSMCHYFSGVLWIFRFIKADSFMSIARGVGNYFSVLWWRDELSISVIRSYFNAVTTFHVSCASQRVSSAGFCTPVLVGWLATEI